MTLYSKINILIAILIIVIGFSIKIILYYRRKKLDGFHGYCTKQLDDIHENNDWQNI